MCRKGKFVFYTSEIRIQLTKLKIRLVSGSNHSGLTYTGSNEGGRDREEDERRKKG